jgi:uncharacterized protein (DUF58 family)
VKTQYSITPTAVLLGLVAIIATFTAFATGALLAHLVAALVLSFLAVSVALAARSLSGVTVTRSVAQSAYDGDDVEVHFTIANAGRTPRTLVEAANLYYTSVGPSGRATGLAADVPAQETVELTSVVHDLRRGEYVFPPPAVLSGDPFGLVTAIRQMREQDVATTRLTVFPRPFPLDRFALASDLSWSTSGLEPTSQAGAAGEFLGTREYRPGDSVRAIHWPLSARMGELIVKEFERSSSTEVSIFLDLDANAAWGEGRDNTLEYAVRIAAAVSENAMQRGNSVQLVAHGSQWIVVPPGKGEYHEHLILHHLASVASTGSTPFNYVIEQMAPRLREGSSAVLIFPSQHIQLDVVGPAVERLFSRRIRLTVIIMRVESFLKRKAGTVPSPDMSAAAYFSGRGATVYVVSCGVDLGRQLSAPI